MAPQRADHHIFKPLHIRPGPHPQLPQAEYWVDHELAGAVVCRLAAAGGRRHLGAAGCQRLGVEAEVGGAAPLAHGVHVGVLQQICGEGGRGVEGSRFKLLATKPRAGPRRKAGQRWQRHRWREPEHAGPAGRPHL